ncbi:MAG: PilZ domain-containing protein [Candidatus Omnitrophota bacterium]
MAGMETRSAVRVALNASVTLKVDSAMKDQIRLLQEEQKANVADISTSGVGIISPVFFPKGAILGIQMDGATLKMKKPINIKGEVRYCSPQPGKKYRMGIKFIEIEDEIMNKIKEYVAKSEQQKAPSGTAK